MKTQTEFSGLVLRRSAQARAEKQAEGLEGEALMAAVGEAVNVGGERLSRLFDAIGAAEGKLDKIRLCRVYQGEQAPKNAVTVGELHYVFDLLAPAGGRAKRGRDGRGPGRDGRGRGGEGRGRGGEGRGRKPGPGREAHGDRGPRREGRGPRREGGRGPGRDVPLEGEGWSLQRAPREEGDHGRRPRRPEDRDRKDDRKPGRPPRGPRQPGAGRADRKAAPGGEKRQGAAAKEQRFPETEIRKSGRKRPPRKPRGGKRPEGVRQRADRSAPTPAAPRPKRTRDIQKSRNLPPGVSISRSGMPIEILENGEINGNIALPPDTTPDDIGNR